MNWSEQLGEIFYRTALDFKEPEIKHKEHVWQMISYCSAPTVTMVNVATGKRETFAITTQKAQEFLRMTTKEWNTL